MVDQKKILERAGDAAKESKHLDFKREFDISSGEAWCEVIKDIVALANSGGGVVVFGVADDGTNSNFDPAPLLAYDTADIANRIARYTGNQAIDLEVVKLTRTGEIRPAFLVSDTDVPIVFTKPGTYDIGGGRQKTAFAQGTIYFRHGSKSEPGNRDDLAGWRDRQIAKARKSWLGGIRKVVQAAPNDHVTVISSPGSIRQGTAVVEAKLTSDPSAVTFVPTNAEEIWPHRQIDLIREVNKRLAGEAQINTHDIYCIKKVYDVLKAYPKFAYKPHHLASPQYSDAFIEWIVDEYTKNKNFFRETRARCRPAG